MIGVLVKYYGIGQAEGFLHVFEGWIIFITCIIALYLEAWVLWRLFSGGHRNESILDIDYRGVAEPLAQLARVPANRMLVSATSLLVVMGLTWQLFPASNATIADRLRFSVFPLEIMQMHGQQEYLDEATEKVLAADDYFVATYKGTDNEVNLLLTYYERQLGGSGIHSPEVCLPSGGWEVSKWSGRDINVSGTTVHVNRAIIQKGLSRQLVYYWFEQRGRKITNDYQAKLVSMWDKMLTGRSDGGLVRLVTPIAGDNIAEADKRLEAFMSTLVPMLPDFYPVLGAAARVSSLDDGVTPNAPSVRVSNL
jgi:exosortase D (VPLPA-CTERM-specific)